MSDYRKLHAKLVQFPIFAGGKTFIYKHKSTTAQFPEEHKESSTATIYETCVHFLDMSRRETFWICGAEMQRALHVYQIGCIMSATFMSVHNFGSRWYLNQTHVVHKFVLNGVCHLAIVMTLLSTQKKFNSIYIPTRDFIWIYEIFFIFWIIIRRKRATALVDYFVIIKIIILYFSQ